MLMRHESLALRAKRSAACSLISRRRSCGNWMVSPWSFAIKLR